MKAHDWLIGQEIAPNVRFGGFTKTGVIFETNKWREFLRMVFIDFMGKYVFRSSGSDITITVRKVSL